MSQSVIKLSDVLESLVRNLSETMYLSVMCCKKYGKYDCCKAIYVAINGLAKLITASRKL